MPEYLVPGVFVEEIGYRSKSIEGVPTDTCAMVGPTRRGPHDTLPELITSLADYERIYGGFADLTFDGNKTFVNDMAHAVRAFFENGGRRLYVSRTYVPEQATGASKAGIAWENIANDVATIEARYPGSGCNAKVRLDLKAVRVAGPKPLEKACQGTLLRIPNIDQPAGEPVRVERRKAPGLNSRANQPSERAVNGGAKAPFEISTEGKTGIDAATVKYYRKKGNQWLDKDNLELKFDPDRQVLLDVLTFTLAVEDADQNVFLYEDLGFGQDHPRYIGKVLPEEPISRTEKINTPYIFRSGAGKTAFDLHEALFGNATSMILKLTGGDDGAEPVLESALTGAVAYSDALEKIEHIEEIAIVAAPGHSKLAEATFRAVQEALVAHAERMKYRFVILDSAPGESLQDVRVTRSRIDSSYAALYYPWVTIRNPAGPSEDNRAQAEINVPPSGFIAGIYARTDITRGVWKAPANVVVRGALGFERQVDQAQQELLNPVGINCLRFFFGRGHRVWGARTASSDSEWKYVNVRRYFIYLAHTLQRGTRWVVFEPNGPRLWTDVKSSVAAFLYTEWRRGGLQGASPEEAFFVRCDRSTMTQSDIDHGRMICEVGVAAIKPAEFIFFRMGQKTADA